MQRRVDNDSVRTAQPAVVGVEAFLFDNTVGVGVVVNASATRVLVIALFLLLKKILLLQFLECLQVLLAILTRVRSVPLHCCVQN